MLGVRWALAHQRGRGPTVGCLVVLYLRADAAPSIFGVPGLLSLSGVAGVRYLSQLDSFNVTGDITWILHTDRASQRTGQRPHQSIDDDILCHLVSGRRTGEEPKVSQLGELSSLCSHRLPFIIRPLEELLCRTHVRQAHAGENFSIELITFLIPGHLQGIIGPLSFSCEKGGDDAGPLFLYPSLPGSDNLKSMEVGFYVVVLG